MTVDGNDVEVVTKEGYRGSNEIRYLGSADNQGRTMREGSAKKYSYGRTEINMDREVMLDTKVKLVNVLVFPIVLYGAET